MTELTTWKNSSDLCEDYVLFMMSMSSDEVNFLVYRYLQESGKCEECKKKTDLLENKSLNFQQV